jgi:hypothetical protein
VWVWALMQTGTPRLIASRCFAGRGLFTHNLSRRDPPAVLWNRSTPALSHNAHPQAHRDDAGAVVGGVVIGGGHIDRHKRLLGR